MTEGGKGSSDIGGRTAAAAEVMMVAGGAGCDSGHGGDGLSVGGEGVGVGTGVGNASNRGSSNAKGAHNTPSIFKNLF